MIPVSAMVPRKRVPARRTSSLGRCTLWCLLWSGLVSPSAAVLPSASLQEFPVSPEDTLHLSLEDAVTAALSNNPTYRQSQNDMRLNSVQTTSLWMSQLLPRLDFSLLSTNFYGNLQRIATDNFGDPIARPDAGWSFFSGTSQSLNISWSTSGLSVLHEYRNQQLSNRSRTMAFQCAEDDLRISIERLYLDALRQRTAAEYEEELVESREFDLDVVNRLFALALRSRVDVLQAELALEQQRAAERRSQGAYDQALLQLRAAIGRYERRPGGPRGD